MHLRAVLLAMVCWGAGAFQALAQAEDDVRLRVGVIERPPFAMQTDDGAWLGIGVELWRLAAEDLAARYTYVPLARGEVEAALDSGAVDLVLPVDATPALERSVDLTHPIYTATMGVASRTRSNLLDVVEGFLSWQFLRLILGLSVLLLAVGAVVWLLERRRNDGQFNASPVKGLGDGFWWAGVTLTTIGYGDKAPVTLAGRAVAMLWMLVGLAVSAALTAAVVTLAGVNREVALPEVLAKKSVGIVAGSSTESFLEGEGLDLRRFASLEEALRALQDGDLGFVAAAAPVLSHVIDERGEFNLDVRTTRLDPHYVSLAVPNGSPLLELVNADLLGRLTSESGWNLIERYLPE